MKYESYLMDFAEDEKPPLSIMNILAIQWQI